MRNILNIEFYTLSLFASSRFTPCAFALEISPLRKVHTFPALVRDVGSRMCIEH